MANLFDKVKQKLFGFYSTFRNIRILFSGDSDYKTVDDLDIVVNRFADAFVSGQLVILDVNGEVTESPIPKRITMPNPITNDWRTAFKAYITGLKRHGVSRIWVTNSTYHVLEESNCAISYNNKNVLSLTKFSDIYSDFRYNSGGKEVDLLREEGDIITIFDIAFSHDDYAPITRASQISNYIKLAAEASNASQGMFKRVAMLFLFRKGNNGIPNINLSEITDKTAKKGSDNFKENYKIGGGAVEVLPTEMGSIETNPDNRKLDAINFLNLAQERFCAQYNFSQKILRGETKFDDLKVVITNQYLTMQSEADKFLAILRQALGIKEMVVMDYSNVIDKMMPDETDETTSTQENE